MEGNGDNGGVCGEDAMREWKRTPNAEQGTKRSYALCSTAFTLHCCATIYRVRFLFLARSGTLLALARSAGFSCSSKPRSTNSQQSRQIAERCDSNTKDAKAAKKERRDGMLFGMEQNTRRFPLRPSVRPFRYQSVAASTQNMRWHKSLSEHYLRESGWRHQRGQQVSQSTGQ